jgi:Tfp pilus assembly protein PilO
MDQFIKNIRQFQIIAMKNPLYQKYGMFLVPSVTILVCLIILFLITIPQGFKLVDNNQSLEEIRQKKTDYQSKITTLNKVDTNEYKSYLNDVLTILPNDKDIPSAINSVLDVLSSAGLTLTNFSLGTETKDKSGSQNFAVKIEVSGTLDQLKNFIDLSEKSSRLIKIVGLTINTSLNGASQASLDLLVYFAPLDSAKTSVDQKITLLSEEDKKVLSEIKQNISSITPNNDQTIQSVPTGKDDPFN